MYKKLIKSLIFFQTIILCCVKAQNPFIENKGQFPDNVISKTNLPSGVLFMEKGRFNYVFYNGKQLEEMHKGTSYHNKIETHSYNVTFINHSKNSVFFLFEPSVFYENYFIGDKKSWADKVRSYKKQVQKDIYEGIDLYLEVQNDKFKSCHISYIISYII